MKPRSDEPMQPSDFRERDRLEGNPTPPAAPAAPKHLGVGGDCDYEAAQKYAEMAANYRGSDKNFMRRANIARCFKAQAEALRTVMVELGAFVDSGADAATVRRAYWAARIAALTGRK